MDGVWLNHPVIQVPLGETYLAILGRISLLWGHIESNTETILICASGPNYGFDKYDAEYGSKSIGSKLRSLKDKSSLLADIELREAVQAFAKAAFAVLDDRNAVAHGLWGWHQRREDHAPAVFQRSKDRMIYATDLPDLYNRLVSVCDLADIALFKAIGVPRPASRNRPFIITDGEEVRRPTT